MKKSLNKVFVYGMVLSLSIPSMGGSKSIGPIKVDDRVATTSLTGASSIDIILDNDKAYDSKIDIVKSASSEIRMAYYIYGKDGSSMNLSNELIQKAKTGTKIKLLVDLHTNYTNLDYFQALEELGTGPKGEKNIQVKFYNPPTKNLMADAVYETTNCPETKTNQANAGMTDCMNEKLKMMESLFAKDKGKLYSDSTTRLSQIYLSGLYSKNVLLMNMAIAQGQELSEKDLAKAQQNLGNDKQMLANLGGKAMKVQEKSGLGRMFALMGFTDQIKKDSAQLDKWTESISGTLPVAVQGSSAYNAATLEADRRHITDFTHHKLLLARTKSGSVIQLGGRNIEDPYHTRPSEMSEKYHFMDTDLVAKFDDSKKLAAAEASYDNLFNSSMTISVEQVRKIMPNDFLVTDYFANKICADKKKASEQEFEGCYQLVSTKYFSNFRDRIDNGIKIDIAGIDLPSIKNQFQLLTMKFNMGYKAIPEHSQAKKEFPTLSLTGSEAAGVRVSYLENLPFRLGDSKNTRIYGAKNTLLDGRPSAREKVFSPGVAGKSESESGKNIHAAMIRGMVNTCQQGLELARQKSSERLDVIFHNAYLFPSSNYIDVWARMIDGRIPCPNVNLKFITNSMLSTDLLPVNILNLHVMKRLFAYYQNVGLKRNASKKPEERGINLSYQEYTKIIPNPNFIIEKKKEPVYYSLHSKVAVFGKSEIFVGSANADVRSYHMDTNNGILLSNAPTMVANYKNWLSENVGPSKALTTTDNAILQFHATEKEANGAPKVYALSIDSLIGTHDTLLKRADMRTTREVIKRFGMDDSLSDSDKAKIDALIWGLDSEVIQESEAIVSIYSKDLGGGKTLMNSSLDSSEIEKNINVLETKDYDVNSIGDDGKAGTSKVREGSKGAQERFNSQFQAI